MNPKLKALKKTKEPAWKVKSGIKTRKAFTALAKKYDNWETRDTL